MNPYFIELTLTDGRKWLFNVAHIRDVGINGNGQTQINQGEEFSDVLETPAEIEELGLVVQRAK